METDTQFKEEKKLKKAVWKLVGSDKSELPIQCIQHSEPLTNQ